MTEAEQRLTRVVTRLLARVRESLPDPPSPYLVNYLAEHVAEAQAWQQLADHGDVVDWLDPHRIAAEALRVAFGRSGLPSSVASVLAGHHVLAELAPEDRATIRAVEASRYSRAEPAEHFVGRGRWSFGWSRLRAEPLHVVLGSHAGRVTALLRISVGQGRSLLATGAEDGTLRLWDPLAGQPLIDPIAAHDGAVSAIVATPGGFVTGGEDGVVREWHAPTGRALGERRLGAAVSGVVVTDSGRQRFLLAAVCADGAVHVWAPGPGAGTDAPVFATAPGANALASLTLPDGTPVIAAGGDDGTVRVWSVDTGQLLLAASTRHDGPITALAVVTVDGLDALATAGADSTVRVLDPRDGSELVAPLSRPVDWITCLVRLVLRDRSLLVAGTDAGGAWILDPATRQARPAALGGHLGPVTTAGSLTLRDGRVLLVTGGEDGTVRLWSTELTAPAPDRAHHRGSVRAVTTYREGDTTLLFTGSADGLIGGWEPSQGQVARPPWQAHPGAVTALCTLRHPEFGGVLVSGGDDGVVRFWSAGTREELAPGLAAHDGWVRTVVVLPLPDGRSLLASGGNDGVVRLWDVATRREVRAPLRGHANSVRAMASVEVGGERILFTAGNDSIVRRWRVPSFEEIGEPLAGHTDWVRAVLPVPGADGAVLVTGGNDGKIIMWDPVSGRQLRAPMVGHSGTVRAFGIVTASQGGRALVSIGGDRTVRLWDVQTGDALHVLALDLQPQAMAVLGSDVAFGTDTGVLMLRVTRIHERER